MIITARLFTPQTNVGYRFYDIAGSLIASRITAGIVALPEPGSYQANSSPPANAVGVFWDCDAAGVTAQASLMTSAAPTSAENATAVRTELATELARIDVAVSSVDSGLPDATITKLNDAEQIILTETFVPTDAPVLIIPLPDPDPAFTIVFGHTATFIGENRAGIKVRLKLTTSPTQNTRILEQKEIETTTNAEGYFQFRIFTGLRYRILSDELGLANPFTPTTPLLDIATII